MLAIARPTQTSSPAVEALVVDACDGATARISMPRPEFSLAVRFGPSAHGGIDVHAFGVRPRAHRKVVRGGHRTVIARLRLGAHEGVLGASAAELAGRVVPLDDLWGAAAARHLADRLAAASTPDQAAALLDDAITQRAIRASSRSLRGHLGGRARTDLALEAARRLATANVNAVAADLGVSERHLRRVFRERLGLSPKTFAKLTRFHRALRAAQRDRPAPWAIIAADAGYYDQAHLIAEFRALADATPRALLREIRAAGAVG